MLQVILVNSCVMPVLAEHHALYETALIYTTSPKYYVCHNIYSKYSVTDKCMNGNRRGHSVDSVMSCYCSITCIARIIRFYATTTPLSLWWFWSLMAGWFSSERMTFSSLRHIKADRWPDHRILNCPFWSENCNRVAWLNYYYFFTQYMGDLMMDGLPSWLSWCTGVEQWKWVFEVWCLYTWSLVANLHWPCIPP